MSEPWRVDSNKSAFRVAVYAELRELIQQYLDQHWSPEQIARQFRVQHVHSIAVETIYQALCTPERVLERGARTTLRTGRHSTGEGLPEFAGTVNESDS